MKKVILTLLVLALAIPAMAATVTITDHADGTGTITVTAEGSANIVGLALDIDVTAGGNITGTVVNTATFNIFMDAAYTEVNGDGYTYGEGTAIASQTAAGQVAISNSFAVSAAALNGENTAGATGSASVTITVTVDADTTISVKANDPRGGIILTDGTGEAISSGTDGVVSGDITLPGGCKTRLTAAEQTTWDLYLAAGKVDADLEVWCNQYQCRGDAANDVYFPEYPTLNWLVYDTDLNMLIANWKAHPDVADPAADFAHDIYFPEYPTLNWAVYDTDLNILIANWKAHPEDVDDCPGYVAP